MMAQRVMWISVCLLIAAGVAGAQERLSLANATTRALEKNHAIRIEREAVAAADARIGSANGAYDRHFRVGIEASRYQNPDATLFSGAPDGRVAPTSTDFDWSASISQLFKTGAVVTVSSTAARQSTDNIYYLFRPAYFTSLGVDLQQPLLRNRAIDPARTAILVTALDRDRSGAALARQAQETVADVETAYWALVAARRDLEVRRGSLALAEQQREDTKVRIEARIAAQSDLAQPTAEVERRRGDLFAAQEAVARAERELKVLILDDLGDPLWASALTPADSPDSAQLSVDVQQALADARSNRPEIAELVAQRSQQDLEVNLVRNDLKPRLDLVATYAVRGLAGDRTGFGPPVSGIPISLPQSLSGGLGDSWGNLFDQKFPDLAVGVSFEMPIGRREAHAKIAAAEAERRKLSTTLAGTHERIAAEVLNAVTALETAAGRIQAARAGLAAAETQLRAEQDRFEAGLSTNFFVLTRQNDLALAQLAEIAAQTDYRKAQTELGRATGSLLRDRNIRIAEN